MEDSGLEAQNCGVMPKQPPVYTFPKVPRLWPEGTIVCLASGPSLTREDVEYVRGKADAVIVINNNYELAPWADVLYATDGRWWMWHKGVPSFQGLKYSLSRSARVYPDVNVLRKDPKSPGIALDPSSLCNYGLNSGYAAINLAVHFGAKRIVLLGYDMQRGPKGQEHWHGEHRNHSRSPYHIFTRKFSRMVEPLERLGVEVLNCSRVTALTCFPQAALRDVLSGVPPLRTCEVSKDPQFSDESVGVITGDASSGSVTSDIPRSAVDDCVVVPEVNHDIHGSAVDFGHAEELHAESIA